MNIAALLQKSARSFGTSPAVSYATHVYLTYSELADRVQQLAASFMGSCGLKRGDRVGIAMTIALLLQKSSMRSGTRDWLQYR